MSEAEQWIRHALPAVSRPTRIQRRRTKGWRMPENTVYVGRGSKFGNPFDWRDYRIAVEPDRECKRMAKCDFESHLRQHPELVARAREKLVGKNLACWCGPDDPCHADTLLRVANGGEP